MQLAARTPEHVDHAVVGVFRRSWWIVAIAWGATLAATALLTARQTPVYRASASLVVVPQTTIAEADLVRSLDTLDRRTIVATFAKLPSTPETRAAAAPLAGLSSRDATEYAVLAGVVPNTNIIKIDVEGPDPSRAAQLCNAVADVVGRTAPQLYRIFALQTIERAVPRSRPERPDMRRNLVAGAIVGLLVGAAAAAAGDYVRRRRAIP